MDEVIEICSLKDILKRDNRKLSGGQRQRLLLALPSSTIRRWSSWTNRLPVSTPRRGGTSGALIEKIRKEGKTIILTTHYMEEAEILCDEVAIMDQGRIIARDRPKRLLKEHFDGVIVTLPWNDGVPEPEGALRVDDHIEIHSEDVDSTPALAYPFRGSPGRTLDSRPGPRRPLPQTDRLVPADLEKEYSPCASSSPFCMPGIWSFSATGEPSSGTWYSSLSCLRFRLRFFRAG